MNGSRLVPLAGPAFVVLVLVTVIGFGENSPTSDASAAELVRYYDDHQVTQFIGAFLFAATVPFLLLFAIDLASRLARGRSGLGSWEQLLVAGAILTGAGILITATAQFALIDAADQNVAPAALQALNAVPNNTWMFFNAALGVMTLGLAGSLVSSGERRKLGWAALVLGVALFIPFADFFALLATLLWITVAGVLLARRPRVRRELLATEAA
jgi:hypothetical protein